MSTHKLKNHVSIYFRLAKPAPLPDEELDPELRMLDDDDRPESFEDVARSKEIRRGIDLATTLERIAKNFVITDPRLPDNPIVRPTSNCQVRYPCITYRCIVFLSFP